MPLLKPAGSGNSVDVEFNGIDNVSGTVSQINKQIEGTGTTSAKAADMSRSKWADMALVFNGVSQAARIGLDAIKQIYSVVKEGAGLERLADSGAEIARQFGGNMDLIVQKVKEASQGTVSEMDIIGSANKAMMLGLGADAEQLANLMEIAAFRGRAMGLSTTQAFDDIVRGIGRGSPMILDNLGIVISAKDRYAEYAEQIGKSASELTKAEKTQALLNAVLNEGNTMLEKAGGLTVDNTAKIERMETAWKNFADNRKRENADLAGDFSDAASKAIDGWDQFFKYIDSQNKIIEIAVRMRDEKDPRGQWQDYYEEARKEWAKQKEATDTATAAIETNIATAEEAAQAIKEMSSANREYLSTVADMTGTIESHVEKLHDIRDANAELQQKKQDLINQGYTPESEAIQDINRQIAEGRQEYEDATAQFELDGKRRILSMLEQRLAIDGLDERETEYLLSKGLEWGVYSDAAVRAAQAAMEEVALLSDEIAQVPTAIPIVFTITTEGAPPNLDTSAGSYSAPVGTHRNSHALGGDFIIPMSYGHEGFPMGGGDTASGGEKLKITPAGKSGNEDIIAAINANRIDYYAFARAVVSAVQQGAK